MGDDFLVYMERLQLMAFFSGYPLVYALAQVFHGSANKNNKFADRLVRSLPFSYALCATAYIGLFLKDCYPDFSWTNIQAHLGSPYLQIWGMMGVCFWIYPLNRKPVFSLLHSFVFFFFIVRDLFIYLTSAHIPDIIRNNMRIFTDSLLLNLLSLAVVLFCLYLLHAYRSKNSQRTLH
ncbi:MAG TPA: hypothetical protein VFZ47_09620 [Chitinophagaceae bacterium]